MAAVDISFDELSVALSYAFLTAAAAPSSSSAKAKEDKKAAAPAPKVRMPSFLQLIGP